MHGNFLIICEYFYIVNMVMGKHGYGYRIGHNSIRHHIIYMPLHALLHRYMQPMVLRRRRNLPDYYYYYYGVFITKMFVCCIFMTYPLGFAVGPRSL